MINKLVQQQLKKMLAESITALCSQFLKYESKICVEGLLGITVDDTDIMLVNLQEIIGEKFTDDEVPSQDISCNDDKFYPEPEVSDGESRDDAPVVVIQPQVAGRGILRDCSTTLTSVLSDDVPMDWGSDRQTHEHRTGEIVENQQEIGEIQQASLLSANKGIERPINSSMLHTQDRQGKTGFFSSTVDQIIKEYESERHSDVSPMVYMKQYRGRYPDLTAMALATAKHTQQKSANSTLGDDLYNLRKRGGALPGHTANQSPANRESAFPAAGAKRFKRNEAKSSSESPREAVIQDGVDWIAQLILCQVGCVVSCRVMCRKFSSLRGEQVIAVMKSMSLPRGSPRYVGEHFKKGRVQGFYKCPPVLLQAEALEPYNMTMQEYTGYYFNNPKPSNGIPDNWVAHIALLMRNAPYSPVLFPLESVGLDNQSLEELTVKQKQWQEELQKSRSENSSVFVGFKDANK